MIQIQSGHPTSVKGSALPFATLPLKSVTLRALTYTRLALSSVYIGVLIADLSPTSFSCILGPLTGIYHTVSTGVHWGDLSLSYLGVCPWFRLLNVFFVLLAVSSKWMFTPKNLLGLWAFRAKGNARPQILNTMMHSKFIQMGFFC